MLYNIFQARDGDHFNRQPFSHPALIKALDLARETCMSCTGLKLFSSILLPLSVNTRTAKRMVRNSMQRQFQFATIVVCDTPDGTTGFHPRPTRANEIWLSVDVNII